MIIEKLKQVTHIIKTLFLSGLVTVVPIAATIFFLNFAYGFIARMLSPLHAMEPSILQKIPGSEFFVITLLIILLGLILRVFVLRSFIHFFERLIARIPFVRIVYSAVKILVDFFKISDATALKKKVVLIPYPKKGQYHIAFLLESAEENYQKVIPEGLKHYPGEKYYKVFMPNSPNPTTGYFFIMPEDEIIHTDITFEEALKTLVSCGLFTPESLKYCNTSTAHTLRQQ